MLFTSGATGPAKGVVYRHRQLPAQLDAGRATICRSPERPAGGGLRAVRAVRPGPRASRAAVPDMDVTAPGTLTAAALADAAAAVDATVVFASPAALRNVVGHRPAALTAEQRRRLGRVRLADVGRRTGAGPAAAPGARRCCRTPSCTPRTG